MAPRTRFELALHEETGFQDQRRNPGLATSAQQATVGNAF